MATAAGLFGGIAALTAYLRFGLRMGPRLGVLMWPATLGPMLGTAGWYNYRRGAGDVDWSILALAPEALAVLQAAVIAAAIAAGSRVFGEVHVGRRSLLRAAVAVPAVTASTTAFAATATPADQPAREPGTKEFLARF